MNQNVVLVGAGNMGIEYAKVLKALKKEFVVVGRSEESALGFEQATGIKVVRGGLNAAWLRSRQDIRKAIVAVDVETLGETARLLIESGVGSILLEKPGGIDLVDLKKTASLAKKKKAKVYLAYNRRFYASVRKVQERVKEDGGALSVIFEFNERIDKMEKLRLPEKVMANWFLANSSHVADLVFFLAGKPKDLKPYRSGKLPWHPGGAVFAGAGITTHKTLFAYHANWASAGRWSVEVTTPRRRLILKPLEELWEQEKGTFEITRVPLKDEYDRAFKPGLYEEVRAFIEEGESDLPNLTEHLAHCRYYRMISGE